MVDHSQKWALEGQQFWGKDGELSSGWGVFNVHVGHLRGHCRVGSWSVGLSVNRGMH